jgi:hypothetical protein
MDSIFKNKAKEKGVNVIDLKIFIREWRDFKVDLKE